MKPATKDRIDVRISREHKELIKLASEMSGFKNLSEFVIYCAKTEATRIIAENDQLLRSVEDKKIFVNAILNPPAPGQALKNALLKYNQFNGDENKSAAK